MLFPHRVVSLVMILAAAGTAYGDSSSTPQDEAYALDAIPRDIAPLGPMTCPDVAMVRYRGDVIRYHKPVRVFIGFRDRLRRFEETVKEVAIEVYGRAPRHIRHKGTYNCRRIRAIPELLSEHALGNGIDVIGFDFASARRSDSGPTGALPRRLRRGFQVRLDRDWGQTDGVRAIHARFLQRLAQRLIERDIFRVMLGPAYPGHQDHFHLDCAPYRLIQI